MPRLPCSSGSTGQWRPLEQLVGPPSRPPPPPSVRPTALTIPPAPPSLQGFADATGPNAASQAKSPRLAQRARSWTVAILALAMGVGIGGALVRRAETKSTAQVDRVSAGSPVAAPARAPAPAAATGDRAPIELAVDRAGASTPVEITLDDEGTPLESRAKDPMAQRRAAQRALQRSVERPSDMLPDFPESTPTNGSGNSSMSNTNASTTTSKKPKTEQQLGEEAKELATKQLESLL